MFSAQLWIGLALGAIVLLSTTANLAIRHSSRVGLAELLERRGRLELLGRLVDARSGLLFTSSLVRLSAMLALVLLIARFFDTQPGSESNAAAQYVAIQTAG